MGELLCPSGQMEGGGNCGKALEDDQHLSDLTQPFEVRMKASSLSESLNWALASWPR